MGCLMPLLLVLIGLGGVAMGLLLFSAVPDPASPVNATNVARLRAGMTFDEVVAVVGEPAPPTFDGTDQAAFCRNGSDTCSWSRCALCDSSLFLTFNKGQLVSKRFVTP
jgi:hypothetical protein